MFSRACEYAIKIMIYIANNEVDGKRMGLKQITNAVESPEAFTAKILQQLVKHRLLDSFKGPSGGFQLKKEKEIRLSDIVIAIDNNKLMDECVLGYEICSGDNPCPIHNKFVAIKEQLEKTLLSTNIMELSGGD